MSATACSYTGIGLLLHERMVSEVRKVKTFDHDYPEDWNVDPKSGKKLWQNAHIPKEGFVGSLGDEYLIFDAKFRVSIIRTPIPGNEGKLFVVEALAPEEVRSEKYSYLRTQFVPVDIGAYITAAAEIEASARRYGLWDPNKFGFWSFTWLS